MTIIKNIKNTSGHNLNDGSCVCFSTHKKHSKKSFNNLKNNQNKRKVWWGRYLEKLNRVTCDKNTQRCD